LISGWFPWNNCRTFLAALERDWDLAGLDVGQGLAIVVRTATGDGLGGSGGNS
jgi:beta-lactamase superfamily II metal-dependent hydrolase